LPSRSTPGFNQPKTLSGIETIASADQIDRLDAASTNPKPFQGLKPQTLPTHKKTAQWLQPTQNPFRD